MEIVLIQSAENSWFQLYRTFGDRFEIPFFQALKLLEGNPEIGSLSKLPPLRRLLVRQSPWGVFYKVESGRIVILAIEDLRQDPETIERKLKNLLPE